MNIQEVLSLTEMWSLEDFQYNYESLIEKALHQPFQRQERWTKALAIGSQGFVGSFGRQVGLNPKRRVLETEEGFEIREESPDFGKIQGKENTLWGNNTFLWNAQESEVP